MKLWDQREILEKLMAEMKGLKAMLNAGGHPGCVSSKCVILELVKAKQAANRRPVYIKSLTHYLNRFAAKFPNIAGLPASEIEGWLSQFTSQYSRQTWMNRISTLFSFAIRRGYLTSNPCERIDRITIDRRAPVILTVEQTRALLKSCPANCRAYLVLAVFAGIRPDEVMRMTWADINLETNMVKVDGKTRQRRIVPLEPVAIQWLKTCAERVGSVAPSTSTVRRWKRACRTALGGKWVQDILRHTAASYLLAKYSDANKISLMLGNSPKILLSHYHDPVTKEAAEQFWSTMP